MDRSTFIKTYWNFYLLLEGDFVNLFSYIDPEPSNYKTHSPILMRQLISVGAEIDTFFRFMCSMPDVSSSTIKNYADAYANDAQYDLANREISFFGGACTLKPFAGWDPTHPGSSLSWWQSYDDVKHNRVSNYSEGSFEKVLYSLSALFLLETLKWKFEANANNDRIDLLTPKSKIFRVKKLVFTSAYFADDVVGYDSAASTLNLAAGQSNNP
jgi:hypothetical protein